MGTGTGTDITNIREDLLKNGPSYNVWQAIRIAEVLSRENNPERKDFLLDQAGLLFRPFENYEFPPTDIRNISENKENIEFVLNFMGLYGVNSPLPRCYHEQVSMQQRIFGKENVPLKSFLDIFNNRFYWLYYQAWKKYRYHLQLSEGNNNKVSQRINSFIGRGIAAPKKDLFVSDYTLLKFSGLLSSRARNKTGLLMLLNFLFPTYKIDIKEFIPRWIEISDSPALGDEDCLLGINSFIGRYALDYMSRIRIEMEPLTFEEYLNFLPGSRNASALNEILKIYLNDGIEYDISFKIKSNTIVSIAWNDDRLRLGSTIWLGTPSSDLTEVIINHEQYSG